MKNISWFPSFCAALHKKHVLGWFFNHWHRNSHFACFYTKGMILHKTCHRILAYATAVKNTSHFLKNLNVHKSWKSWKSQIPQFDIQIWHLPPGVTLETTAFLAPAGWKLERYKKKLVGFHHLAPLFMKSMFCGKSFKETDIWDGHWPYGSPHPPLVRHHAGWHCTGW